METKYCECNCGTIIPEKSENGRPRRFAYGHRMIKIKEIIKEKKCSKCKKILPIDKFKIKNYRSKADSRQILKCYNSWCNPCEYANIPRATWQEYKRKNLENMTIKQHIQEIISTWRNKSVVASDIDVDYLLNLYEKQNGLCYYTKKEMVFNQKQGKPLENSLSLDKLEPEKGYVKENLVWCCFKINTMKGNCSEKDFYNLMQNILKIAQMTNGKTII